MALNNNHPSNKPQNDPQSTSLEVSMLTIKPPMVKEIGQKE
jgi:hypothetical protein